ncbi:MAG: exodeoxyribonuclease VII small subunit [Lachnospiraceae bacterium]
MGTEMAEQKEQTLEEIFGEMEGLLEALESREISLEDSFEKYKEGMALLKAAGEKIDTVEKAMLVLNDQGEADEF